MCRQLRNSKTLAEAPVVMVTALDDQASRLEGIEAGADDFASQPFNRSELRARVRTITRLNRYRRLLVQNIQLHWLLDHAPDGYLLLEKDGVIVYANGQARGYLGLAADVLDPAVSFTEQAGKQYRLKPGPDWRNWSAHEDHGPLFLVRPESPTAAAFWIRVDELRDAGSNGGSRLIQLRDASGEMSNRIEHAKLSRLVAHKLNTPLNQVSTGLFLVEDMIAGEPAHGELQELVQIASDATKQLSAAVRQIMQYTSASYSPQQTGRFGLDQLPAFLQEIADTLEIERFTPNLPENLKGIAVAVAESTLSLILYELMENARKFHPAKTPAIDCRVESTPDGRILFRITDDGIHLSPPQLADAFQPYAQAEKYATGETPGMGLGLPLVRNLVWEYGGTPGC